MEEIKRYEEKRDYQEIMHLLKEENWQSFYEERKEEYRLSLLKSDVFVLLIDNKCQGFIRGITDGLFTLFIPEIVIGKEVRRKGHGTKLITHLHSLYPKTRIELISDEDVFYLHQGFHIVGNGMRKHNWY